MSEFAFPFTLGCFHDLEVRSRADQGLYLGGETQDAQVLLPNADVPEHAAAVGDTLRVFLYSDSEDRPIATTRTPKAVAGEFALLRVVDRNAQGAFLDWGLRKDLFAPWREQAGPLEIGDERVFAVVRDERDGRLKAASVLGPYLDYDVRRIAVGQRVDLLVYDHNELGALVVVDQRHTGLVYANEAFRELKVGDRLEGFVKFVRDDNKLDIRLQRAGRAANDDHEATILAALEAEGGFLALHDKSPPEAIYARLQMSKKAFKRALGGLYKKRVVELVEGGVRKAP